jgi:TatD DNase family protein
VIDTHAHLDGCSAPASALMERARSAGVTRVVTVGSGVDSCKKALHIADSEPGVVAALGIHPHLAGEATAADLKTLRELLDHPGAVAVGEAGLDYFRDYAPRRRQREIFETQAALAVELEMPLVVHTRDADEDTLAVLTGLPAGSRVVLHCFSSPDLLQAAADRGWYMSFAGNVTYPKAAPLREAAARVPESLILAETDSPYLSPQPARGTANEPANVMHVLATLAEARNVSQADLERRIDDNANAAFGLD